MAADTPEHLLPEGLASDGSPSHPFRTFDELVLYLETEGPGAATSVGLWSGNHQLPNTVFQTLSAYELPVQTCGQAETVLLPTEGTPPGTPLIVISDDAFASINGLTLTAIEPAPAIEVTGASSVQLNNMAVVGHPAAATIRVHDTPEFSLSNSTISGGTHGIWTSGSTTTLTADNTVFDGSSTAGIWTSGSTTTLTDVTVSEVTGLPGFVDSVGGWGVVVRSDAFEAEALTVRNVKRIGVFVKSSLATINDLSISNVDSTESGLVGRGLHISGFTEDESYVSVDNAVIQNVADAGIFIRNATEVNLADISIEDVAPATLETEIPDDTTYDMHFVPVETGDGLVVVQRTAEGDPAAAENVIVNLTGVNNFINIARAGIIADSSTLNLYEIPETMETGLADGSFFVTQHSGELNLIDLDMELIASVTTLELDDDEPSLGDE